MCACFWYTLSLVPNIENVVAHNALLLIATFSKYRSALHPSNATHLRIWVSLSHVRLNTVWSDPLRHTQCATAMCTATRQTWVVAVTTVTLIQHLCTAVVWSCRLAYTVVPWYVLSTSSVTIDFGKPYNLFDTAIEVRSHQNQAPRTAMLVWPLRSRGGPFHRPNPVSSIIVRGGWVLGRMPTSFHGVGHGRRCVDPMS